MKTKIRQIKLSEIKPYKNNATIHTSEQIAKIKKSIEDNGYTSLISVDKSNTIVAGEGRWRALTELYGPDKNISVIDLSILSPKKIKKLRLLDNSLKSNKLDNDLLMKEIDEIFKDVEQNIEAISDELNIELDKIAARIEKEEAKETKKKRSSSIKVFKVILEYPEEEHKKFIDLADKAMSKTGATSYSDLFLSLLEKKRR